MRSPRTERFPSSGPLVTRAIVAEGPLGKSRCAGTWPGPRPGLQRHQGHVRDPFAIVSNPRTGRFRDAAMGVPSYCMRGGRRTKPLLQGFRAHRSDVRSGAPRTRTWNRRFWRSRGPRHGRPPPRLPGPRQHRVRTRPLHDGRAAPQRLGHVYFAVVRPFHRLIVPYLLGRAARLGWRPAEADRVGAPRSSARPATARAARCPRVDARWPRLETA